MLYIKNISVVWNDCYLGNISGQFHEGQISVITGDNGVGKTTLLYSIGLLRRTTGYYIYNNISIDLNNQAITHQFRYQKIYILLQELSLYDDMQLKDYLDFMSGNKKISYDIPFPLYKKISDFSLGEKQYIFIYGGFLQDKEIYLFDEPTSALDKHMKMKIYQLFYQLKEKGKILIVITHDQELIDIGDCIYEFKNQQLILQKKTQTQFKNYSTYKKMSHFLLFKTRLYSQSFRNVIFMTILLSLLLLCVGHFIQNQKNIIENQFINGTRQNIIIYSLEEPDISDEYCHKEPYYFYKYQNISFINQALPITFKESKTLDGNDFHIQYYQEDSVNYIKEVNSSFSKQQIGYLLTFDDPTLYSSLIKQVYNQYSIKNVQSLYLEKQNRITLEKQKNMIMKFYYVCVLIIMIFISFFYCRKTVQQNLHYILLLDFIGYTNVKKILFFIYEIMINALLSLIILWEFHFEWFVVVMFVMISYTYFLKDISKDFSDTYRMLENMMMKN